MDKLDWGSRPGLGKLLGFAVLLLGTLAGAAVPALADAPQAVRSAVVVALSLIHI